MDYRVKTGDVHYFLCTTIVFLIFLFIPCLTSDAQNQQAVFENLSNRNGISQSNINDILQDRNGFLWFATYDGLNKYDGYTYKVYRRNQEDKTTLSSNGIIKLFEDKNGYLYFGTNTTGVVLHDPRTEEFTNYQHNQNDPESIGGNTVYYITQDSKDNIWMCADNTLNLFILSDTEKGQKGKFKQYRNENSTINISCIYEDSRGSLLVFSDSLLILDPELDCLVNTSVPLYNTLVI